MRKNNALEHELSFAYLRMKRHMTHPHRKEVGDPTLPPENVVVEMRSGRNKHFLFWRDLRPPFFVLDVLRVPDTGASVGHPEGDLHEVTYECAIDYHGERLWKTKSDNSTFDNKVHGKAMVRIPDGWPRRRPIIILSWGTPALNWSPSDEVDNEGNSVRPKTLDPKFWMPIADELGQRPDLPRFGKCRDAMRRADSRRGTQTKPLQKLLLGPHAGLAKMAKTQDLNGMSPTSRAAAAARLLDAPFPPITAKPRQHCIYTAAAGFVRYAG